eukprot:1399087-Prymnesium_polylepis.2
MVRSNWVCDHRVAGQQTHTVVWRGSRLMSRLAVYEVYESSRTLHPKSLLCGRNLKEGCAGKHEVTPSLRSSEPVETEAQFDEVAIRYDS